MITDGDLDFPCVSIDSAIVSGCFFQWKAWRHYDDNTGDAVCNNGSGDDDDYDDNCLLLLGLKFYIIMFQKSLRAPVGKIWYWHGDVRTAHSSISWKQGYASVELMIANQNFENLCVISILAMIILQKTCNWPPWPHLLFGFRLYIRSTSGANVMRMESLTFLQMQISIWFKMRDWSWTLN